jgi:hypothetical protein
MKKFSKSTSIICTERVFLYPADQNTKVNGVKWGFRQRRKKFSSKQLKWRECREWQTKTYMWRYRKNGQKWPKNGGPKRVKNGQKWGSKKGSKKAQKLSFSTLEKLHDINETMMTSRIIKTSTQTIKHKKNDKRGWSKKDHDSIKMTRKGSWERVVKNDVSSITQ